MSIANLYVHINVYMLIIARMLGFFIMLPVISGMSLPIIVKIMLSMSMAGIVYFTGDFTYITYDNNLISFGMLIAEEFLVGLIIGFTFYTVFSIIYFAGQIMDYQIGFTMVSLYDPMTQAQVPIVGNLLYLMMSMLLIQSGGLSLLVSAMVYSYASLPIGTETIIGNQALFLYLLESFSVYFALGLKLALPIVGAFLVLDMALGILVKAVPQMNVFVVGVPIKVLIGLLILFIITPAFSSVYDYLFDVGIRGVANVMGGMSP